MSFEKVLELEVDGGNLWKYTRLPENQDPRALSIRKMDDGKTAYYGIIYVKTPVALLAFFFHALKEFPLTL